MRVSKPVQDESTSSDGHSDFQDASSLSGTDHTHRDDTGSSSGSDAEEAQGPDPFEQLLQQKQEGGLLPKGSAAQQHPRSHSYSKVAKRDFKRVNKNRPIEQSSKRPVPRHRQVVELRNSESRDPRFENLSGKFSTDQFRKQYAFVYDEALPEEKRDLKSQMQKTRDSEARQQLQTQLARVEQQIKEEQTRRQQQTALKSHKAEEREAVKQGKKPFFLKHSEAKRQELVARYKHLKATGGLEKVVQKRRRKNAMKDHRYVPSSRNLQ